MPSRSIAIDLDNRSDDCRVTPSGNRLDERLLMGRLRRELLDQAFGEVLDLACGDGVNFPHYPEACRLTAGDIDPLAVTRAQAAARRMNRPVDVQFIDAQAIPFPDNAFDTVVSSMALCSYPDPLRALEEMSRVCRPGGRILLLEHGRSRLRLWATRQDAQERRRGPHTGCHQNREPLELVLRAGMKPVAARRTWFGMIHLINAKPATSPGPARRVVAMQEQSPPIDTDRNAPAPVVQRAIVIIAAAIAALLIWLVSDPIAGVTLEAETANGDIQRIGPIAIIIVTTVGGLLGWALLALLERTTSHPGVIWSVIAVILLFASLLGAWGGTSTSARVTLLAIHLAVGAILIGGFLQTSHISRMR